ncbi:MULTISPECIES: GNAT family N-acetyltransferase [unclassified Halorubrum]|uniref:GNAT family N-acetyltransferase n=1 Tax=unclassified Halorubrum TaxID=2642239 RepID=UPI000B98562A|nr:MULTISPECIES: GNAT family N-acetyltransferase [unclassified Halorubrum]OYR48122.1 GNAT family N-acetyltransferase [Halorubrum sp. Eb13]OYR52641.1 GNAT family N-acetyltransferase [Halorubrum sp. Ea1]
MSDDERPTVAPATVDDVDDVTDLWVALAEDQRSHGSTLLAEPNRTAVREWVARSVVTGELLVARDGDLDGAPVGFVGFSIDREGYERDRVRGTVSNLFVVSERRGEGIGADLLDAAERALAAAGAETVALEALADNDRARAFYDSRGYDLHRVELTKSLSERVGDESDTGGSAGGTE